MIQNNLHELTDIRENRISVKECPLCGSEVDAALSIRIIQPEQNYYGDEYLAHVRFKARCPKCYITQDVFKVEPKLTRDEVMSFIEQAKTEMVDTWNRR